MTKRSMALTVLAAFLVFAPALAESLDSAGVEDRGQETSDREQELYDEGTEALDDSEWRVAIDHFREVARIGGKNSDAALYWQAYAQNRMGQRSEALSTLVDLQKRFPKSRWSADGKALEVEVRQSAGQRVAPENVPDEDLKLIAVSGLMHTDPERAVPILEKIINSNQPPKVKDKAIFVLSQSGSPRAMEVLAKLARDNSRPELQSKAIRNLGILGGEQSRKLLAEVYASSNDVKIKKSILKSYMISGDRARLLALARGEANPELRADAVQQLGIIGARQELADLYSTERAIEVRKKIIQAMFIGGNADKLAELARTETVLELRVAAIKNLGLMGGDRTSQLLVSMYETDTSPEVRKAVINGLFLQSNGKALVALARKEKDPAMKKQIVSKLALIGSPESEGYLMEIINQ